MPLLEILIPALVAAASAAASQATSKSGKVKQAPTMSPHVQKLLDWAGNRSQQMTQNPLEGFGDISKAATSAYQRDVLPQLLEQYAGAMSSPSLEGSLKSSGTDLQERLAALGAQYAGNREGMAQNWMRLASQPRFENVYMPGGHTPLSAGLQSLSSMAGTAAGMGLSDWYQNKQIGRLGEILKGLGGNQQNVEPEYAQQTVARMIDPIYKQQNEAMDAYIPNARGQDLIGNLMSSLRGFPVNKGTISNASNPNQRLADFARSLPANTQASDIQQLIEKYLKPAGQQYSYADYGDFSYGPFSTGGKYTNKYDLY
jgi:hypothetical protein